MDASTDGLVVAHGHCSCVICTRLVVEAAVKSVNKLCYIYVYVMPEQIPGVTFHYKCINMYQYVFIMLMYGEPPWHFFYPS